MKEFNKFITGDRIRDLREAAAETQGVLAKLLGVKQRQIVSYYENGTRMLSMEHLVSIASHYNTTTDYLLGLSDTSTTDKDLKFICDYTGLNDDVADNIVHNPEIVKILNYLLSDEKIFDLVLLCVNLEAYRRKTAEFTEYKKSVLSNASDNSLFAEDIYEKILDYIDSNDLKEFQTRKAFKTIQNSLFDFFNTSDKDVNKDFEELLQRLWEKQYG